MFILSKTQGNKPRRRGKTRINGEIINGLKGGQNLHSLRSHKLFRPLGCFLWCGALRHVTGAAGSPRPAGTSRKAGLGGLKELVGKRSGGCSALWPHRGHVALGGRAYTDVGRGRGSRDTVAVTTGVLRVHRSRWGGRGNTGCAQGQPAPLAFAGRPDPPARGGRL